MAARTPPLDVQYPDRYDGILGLTYDATAVRAVVPPLYHLWNKGLLDEPVFAFSLGASKEDGEVTFGGIDSSAYKGELTYIPVRRKGHWEVELNMITMDGFRLWLEHPRAVIDTGKATSINASLSSIVMRFIPGTSLLVLPADIAERLNLRIAAKKSANGQWIVRCNTVPSLPDITFFLGGKSYSLKATDYILEV